MGWSDVVLVLLFLGLHCDVMALLTLLWFLWLKCCLPKLFLVENVVVTPAIPSVVVAEGP